MVKTKKTTIEVASELEAHERECAIRYANIEKRLDSGQARFTRIEAMIVGIYGLLIASQILDRMF
tara:strand:+ start:415 stop:609 length:195 start_codon:yes stop_codon:yes gene_type:complete